MGLGSWSSCRDASVENGRIPGSRSGRGSIGSLLYSIYRPAVCFHGRHLCVAARTCPVTRASVPSSQRANIRRRGRGCGVSSTWESSPRLHSRWLMLAVEVEDHRAHRLASTSCYPAMMRDLAALRRGRVALRRDGEANQLSFSDGGMLIDDRLLTKLQWAPILPVTGNPRCRSGLFGRLSLPLASRSQRPSNQCERWLSDRD